MRNILERLRLERRIACALFALLFLLMALMHFVAPRSVPSARVSTAATGSEIPR